MTAIDKQQPEEKPQEQPKRKRLEVFYAKDAGPLDEERMPSEGATPDMLEGIEQVNEARTGAVRGEFTRVLFSEPGDEGMSLVYAWFKSGYVLPPHSHNSDCLYYVIGGELRMGKHTLRKGDGFFIPADHGYAYEAGPDGVEVLEFRNATKFNIKLTKAGLSWEKIAAAYRDNSASWATETPPSDR